MQVNYAFTTTYSYYLYIEQVKVCDNIENVLNTSWHRPEVVTFLTRISHWEKATLHSPSSVISFTYNVVVLSINSYTNPNVVNEYSIYLNLRSIKLFIPPFVSMKWPKFDVCTFISIELCQLPHIEHIFHNNSHIPIPEMNKALTSLAPCQKASFGTFLDFFFYDK